MLTLNVARRWAKYRERIDPSCLVFIDETWTKTNMSPWLFDGPINGEAFQIYVERVLVPTSRPGDIVIMDDLGPHKSDVWQMPSISRIGVPIRRRNSVRQQSLPGRGSAYRL